MTNIEELSDWERTLRSMPTKQIQDSLGARSGLFANPKAIGGENPVGPFDAHDVATEAAMAKILAKRKPMQPMYRGNGQDYSAYASMMKDRDALASANSLEAERNKAKGFLGINKRDDGSTYFTGSEQVRQNLEKSIADYDKEIAKLQAEIAMSEAGDPMYDLAVMRMVMNDDMSLMNDIRGRIAKKIDQEFQMKQKKADQEFQHEENELNRENTLETARMNKQEQKEAQQRDLDNAFASAKQLYEFALGDLEANPNDPNLKREVEKAKELFRQAAVKANKVNEFNERIANNTGGKPLWDEAGAAYSVIGKTGLKALVDSIKNPKIKADMLRNLEKSYYITEGDLGYSGAEAKINENKAKASETLEQKITAATKIYGKGDAGKKARDKAYDDLSDEVKAYVIKGYQDGSYIIKRKGK